MKEKKKNYTWLKIFSIVCVVAIAIICAINGESDDSSVQNDNKNVSQFETFKKSANILDDFIMVNEYYGNLKYIEFSYLSGEITTLMLYENDSCWIYYNSTTDNGKASNSYDNGYYKVQDSKLVLYTEDGFYKSYEIIDGGIKDVINGFSFDKTPTK